MRALLQFLQRHHLLLLFLILEGIAIVLLFQNNYIQRIALGKATNIVSGVIYEQISGWRDYLQLREQNQQLQKENAELRNSLRQAFYIADSTRFFYYDSIKQRRYMHIPARVINNEVNRQHNYITLDRGRNAEIAENMAVIGPDGIIGVVYSVSERFARVMPVINRNFRVSAKIKKNNHFGSLSWEGRSYRHATLNEIPLHVPVSVGDTLVVSGFSASFPEGILVGSVSRVEPRDGSFYNIEVLLATNFRKLNYVTVVEDLMKDEQQALEQQTFIEL